MPRAILTIPSPRRVELRQEPLPAPAAGQVSVRALCSAISAGTELLIYRGEFPKNLPDLNDRFSSDVHYPWPCGYACTGQVTALGPGVDSSWEGRRVFSFQPHCTEFVAAAADLIPLPEGITPQQACFLPNMETAVNLVQDAAPILGERALVLGQGVVGLLVASLLGSFSLQALLAADKFPLRRQASPAPLSLDPSDPDFLERARALLNGGADLTFELSGSPAALDSAIALTLFTGRVVIGSWYGEKRASLDLGGSFHRSRLKLISSQVSTIAPELSARWDKARRFEVAWSALRRLGPERWITHRFPISDASEAYRLLDESPGDCIQVIFEY